MVGDGLPDGAAESIVAGSAKAADACFVGGACGRVRFFCRVGFRDGDDGILEVEGRVVEC